MMDEYDRKQAEASLRAGTEYPYDAPDEGVGVMRTGDWATRAARGVLSDLTGRKGVGDELEQVYDDIRVEIVQALENIIRVAAEPLEKAFEDAQTNYGLLSDEYDQLRLDVDNLTTQLEEAETRVLQIQLSEKGRVIRRAEQAEARAVDAHLLIGEIYALVTRQLAEPMGDTAAFVEIASLIEAFQEGQS